MSDARTAVLAGLAAAPTPHQHDQAAHDQAAQGPNQHDQAAHDQAAQGPNQHDRAAQDRAAQDRAAHGAAWHGTDLARRAGLSSGSLYPTLVRLQRAGLVEAHWSAGRRAYRLTDPLPAPAARRHTPRPAPLSPAASLSPASLSPASLSPPAPLRPHAPLLPPTPLRPPVLLWLPAVLAALITAWAVLARPAGVRLSDLAVYTGAVEGLTRGASLYDFISAGNAPFTYPPFAGLVFLPLAGAPAVVLQLAWTLATIVTVAALALLLDRHAPAPIPAPARRLTTAPIPAPAAARLSALGRWAAVFRPALGRLVAAAGLGRRAPVYGLVLVLSAPVSSDLKYGQVSIFLAALIAVDLLALRRSRWQGLLIGLAAAIKLTPLIFIPLLWLAGRRRAAVLAAATFAGCGALAGLALPADSWRFWTTEVSHVSRLGYITSVGNQSLNGALLRVELSAPVRSAVVLLVGGGIAALALRRAARRARAGDWFSALVLTGAASVVLSPVSWTHHQIWLVLAALLPVGGSAWARRAWPALVLAVMLLPVPALGPPLCDNSRLLLAITIAALLPLRHPAPPPPPRPDAAPPAATPAPLPDAAPRGADPLGR